MIIFQEEIGEYFKYRETLRFNEFEVSVESRKRVDGYTMSFLNVFI